MNIIPLKNKPPKLSFGGLKRTYFLTNRKFSITNASSSVAINVFMASVGVSTIGSFSLLNDVFRSIGTPVMSEKRVSKSYKTVERNFPVR